MNFKVSIIIPNYNRENYILKSVESILSQTYPNFELIIIDDGSTDGSCSIIKQIQLFDKRIKTIFLDTNHGANRARNLGLAEAEGDLISFLDSDDIWLPDKLEKQIHFLNHSSICPDIVYCRYQKIHDGNTICHYPARYSFHRKLKGNLYNALLSNGNFIGLPTVLLKRKIIDSIRFDEALPRLQDWDFFIRIAKRGYSFDFLAETLVIVNSPDISISRDSKAFIEALDQIYQKHYLNKNNDEMLSKYWQLRGYSLYSNGDYTEARNALKKAIKYHFSIISYGIFLLLLTNNKKFLNFFKGIYLKFT